MKTIFSFMPRSLSTAIHNVSHVNSSKLVRSASSLVTYERPVSEVYQILSSSMKSENPIYCNFISSSLGLMIKNNPRRPIIRAIDFDKNNSPATEITIEKLITEGNKVGTYFENQGIKKGETVALMLGQDATWWYSVVGLMKSGIGIVPCPRLLTEKDIQYRINDLNVRGMITTPELGEKVNAIKRNCPSLATIVTSQNNGFTDLPPDYGDKSNCLRLPNTTTHDPCVYLYTSGTTGQPKAAQHNHSYPFFHWTTGKYWMQANETDIVYNASDTGWGFSLWTTLGAWATGAKLLITNTHRKFDPQRMLHILEKEPITIFCAAPTVLRLLAAQPNFSHFKFKHLRRIVTVGEALDEFIIELFKSRGIEVFTGFGQAETTLLIGRNQGQAHIKSTMGREMNPYKIDILDDELRPVPPDQTGQIAVNISDGKRNGLFSHYANNPERTHSAFSKDGKYYLTKDRGVRNKDGLFYHIERMDDVIKSHGYRIGPTEVEEAGMSHPAVAKIAVIGKHLKNGNCIVKAFVLLKEGEKPSMNLVSSIQAHIKHDTSPFKYPREIEFLDAKEWSSYETYSGKVKRDALRSREAELMKNYELNSTSTSFRPD